MAHPPRSSHGYAEIYDPDTAYLSHGPQPPSLEPLREKSATMDDSRRTKSELGDERLPLGKAIKKYPKVLAYSLSLCVVVIGWGYAGTVIGDISGVDSFKKDYGHMYEGQLSVPSLWLSLWMASTPIGMTLGSVFAGWFQDFAGRRMSFFAGSFISAVGCTIVLCSIFPTNLEMKRAMLFAGMTFQGLAIGNLKITGMTFISEIAPPALRASVMALIPTGNLIGQLLGFIMLYVINGIEEKTGYMSAFGSQFVLAIAPFIMACCMPESPAFLEEKGQGVKAILAAEKIFAPRANPESALQKIRDSIAEERALSGGATFAACFTGTNFRRTMIVIMANLFPAMFGLDLLSKASYFMQTIGMKSSHSLMIMVGGIVAGIASNAVGIWVQSRVGRRPSTIISMGVAAVLWTGMGVVGFWRGALFAYITSGILLVIVMVCGLGCWPAGYAVMGETSSLRLRAKTQAIGGVAQQLSAVVMAFGLPYIFNTDAGNLGGKTGFVFTFLTSLAVVLCFFFLPEMKGRSQEEIDHMFNIGLPARQFKNWKGGEEMRKMVPETAF
ncbi:MFS transporter fmqE [Paramyrothecium foliicola]|nr:MFS transporter fmqE [Paramyrothecium foliicola]